MGKIQLNKYSLKGYSNVLSDSDERKIWFTSDTHFGHNNVIGYCNRPFTSVVEMNNSIIENWNRVVCDDDIVFHLGDVQLGGGNKLMDEIFPLLKGHIILILGNHDGKNLKRRHIDLIDDCFEQLTVNIDGINCILSHYPLCISGKNPTHEFNLHGHLHSVNDKTNDVCNVLLQKNHYDVGVDNNNFTPIRFKDIKDKIFQRLV
jgi:calcineurin-like phosphoesterase family protein